MKCQKVKKLIVSLVSSVAVLCISALAANVTATTTVNVRTSPDMKSDVVMVLPKDASAEKVNTFGNWIEVKYNGKTGYVYKTYVKDQADTGNPSGTAAQKKLVYVTASSLTVRAQPNATSAKLGALVKNTAVQALEIKNGWVKITYNGKTGYISEKYTTTTKPANVYQKTLYAKDSVTVYSVPKTTGAKLGTLAKNTEVIATAYTSHWYTIMYNGTAGYVEDKYMTTTKPSTPAAPTQPTTVTVYTTSALNVRSAPNTTTGKVIGALAKGAEVKNAKKTGNWYEISYKGQTGYISASFVTTTKPGTPAAPTQPTTVTVYTTSALNVRSAPNTTTGKVIGSLAKGAEVKNAKKTGNWYEISYQGKTGYISANFTTTKKP